MRASVFYSCVSAILISPIVLVLMFLVAKFYFSAFLRVKVSRMCPKQELGLRSVGKCSKERFLC